MGGALPEETTYRFVVAVVVVVVVDVIVARGTRLCLCHGDGLSLVTGAARTRFGFLGIALGGGKGAG